MKDLNVEEFNEKYKDYLKDRFYGLAISDPDVIHFLDDIFDNVLTKLPDFKYLQIKLKFGASRCYIEGSGSQIMSRLIESEINEILKESE